MNDLPRVDLTGSATPVQSMTGLSKYLGGPTLLVKRDDTGTLALGGNKTRKLEYLLGDALARGADTLITAGGIQSNHCRLTAAAAAMHGLGCQLVLGATPPDSTGNGNLLLDQLLGARVHWCQPDDRDAQMQALAAELSARGRRPYVIPVGGSNGLGAVGYVLAMRELSDQLRDAGQQVDHIVLASSSGGTQAGLVLGAALTGFQGRILGISIDQHKAGGLYPRRLAEIANQCAALLGVDARLEPADFHLSYDFLGGGYGVLGALEREAITLAARHQGLLVGPVYTGRALGALIAMIRGGQFQARETVLFWHTGDVPALFAYAGELGDL